MEGRYDDINRDALAMFEVRTAGLDNDWASYRKELLLLFAGSWWLRYSSTDLSQSVIHLPSIPALVLSFAGFALAGVAGWLGGELVDRLSVGVDDGANLDAPSSLAGSAARQKVRSTSTSPRARLN